MGSKKSDPALIDPRIRADVALRLHSAVTSARSVLGGDIHQAFQLALEDGRQIFVKTSASTPPGLFAAEAAGLRWLASFDAIATPSVLAFRDQGEGGPGYLALSWHAPSRRGDPALSATFGHQLALLHSNVQDRPGWTQDVFIGPLPQGNQTRDGESWADFWIHRRLLAMARLANRSLDRHARALVEQVADRCRPLLDDVPALGPLHGDLWGGNALWTAGGGMLIDPAVYAGDPEVDLAMMALFSGFPEASWRAYHDVQPRRDGWQARRALYQMWPLLVHVALFGSSYCGQTAAAAKQVLSAV